MVSGWPTPGRCSSCSPDNEILRQEMQRWQHYAGQVMFGLKDRLIVSHVARRRGREDGTSGYLADSRVVAGVGLAPESKTWKSEGALKDPHSQLAGSWKLTCPWTFEATRATPTAFDEAASSQPTQLPNHLDTAQCTSSHTHNNTRPAQQTPCDCHLLISIPKDHERIRPYHPEARQVA